MEDIKTWSWRDPEIISMALVKVERPKIHDSTLTTEHYQQHQPHNKWMHHWYGSYPSPELQRFWHGMWHSAPFYGGVNPGGVPGARMVGENDDRDNRDSEERLVPEEHRKKKMKITIIRGIIIGVIAFVLLSIPVSLAIVFGLQEHKTELGEISAKFIMDLKFNPQLNYHHTTEFTVLAEDVCNRMDNTFEGDDGYGGEGEVDSYRDCRVESFSDGSIYVHLIIRLSTPASEELLNIVHKVLDEELSDADGQFQGLSVIPGSLVTSIATDVTTSRPTTLLPETTTVAETTSTKTTSEQPDEPTESTLPMTEQTNEPTIELTTEPMRESSTSVDINTRTNMVTEEASSADTTNTVLTMTSTHDDESETVTAETSDSKVSEATETSVMYDTTKADATIIADTTITDTPILERTKAATTIFDTTIADATIADTIIGDTTMAGTTIFDTTIVDAIIGDTTMAGTTKDDTTIADITIGDTTMDGTTKDDRTMAGTTIGGTTMADTTNGDTTMASTTKGDATIGDTTIGDTTIGDTTIGDTTIGDTTKGDTTKGDTTKSVTTIGTTTIGDTTIDTTTIGDTTIPHVTTTVDLTVHTTGDSTVDNTDDSTVGGTVDSTTQAEMTTTFCAGKCLNGGVCTEISEDPGFECECLRCHCSDIELNSTCGFELPVNMSLIRNQSHPVDCALYWDKDGILTSCTVDQQVWDPDAGWCLHQDDVSCFHPPDPTVAGGEDPCSITPCANGGTCTSNITEGSYECECPIQICSCAEMGDQCEYDTDDCSGPNEANTYHYYRDDPWCRRYYQCGAPGQGIARPDRSCDPGQLVNLQDGSCQDAAGFECYVAPTPPPDPCMTSPCQHGGTCMNDTDDAQGYRCQCPPTPCGCADQGHDCEYNVDDCIGVPFNSYHHNRTDPTCRSWYQCHGISGSFQDMGECPQGEINSGNSVSCVPNQGYTCINGMTDPDDPCATDPCMNNGVCVNDTTSTEGYQCQCPETPCPCADQGHNCEYAEDNCQGVDFHSFHLFRLDPTCRQYYRCSNDNTILGEIRECPPGQIYDVSGGTSETGCFNATMFPECRP